MSTEEIRPLTVLISGSVIPRRKLADVISQALIDNHFTDVKLTSDTGEDIDNTDLDMESIMDAVSAMCPNLFHTPIVIVDID